MLPKTEVSSATSRAEFYPYPPSQVELRQAAQLYFLAGRICQVAKIQYVIEIGGRLGAHLVDHFKGAVFLGIVPTALPCPLDADKALVRVVHVDFDTFLQLDEEILQQALIVWPRMDHDLRTWPGMASTAEHWLSRAAFAVVSHSEGLAGGLGNDGVSQLQTQQFRDVLSTVEADGFILGAPLSAGAGSQSFHVALGGRHALYQPQAPVSVLAIVSCFNDTDMIEQVVAHLMGEGVQMHFIDNWSDDGTWEKLVSCQKRWPQSIVGLERFPAEQRDAQFNWNGILMRKEDIAHDAPHDWFIHYDSDELRTTCWPGVSLVEGISFIDHLGYDAINHFVIDFRPTRDGFTAQDDVKTFFRHFERNNVQANHLQIKAWKKQVDHVQLAPSGGHIAWFPHQKVYPLCFLLSHYSLRSTAQARRKIYEDRLPRVVKEHAERRYHGHYHRYQDKQWLESKYIWQEKDLIVFQPEQFNSDYFIPRLVGE